MGGRSSPLITSLARQQMSYHRSSYCKVLETDGQAEEAERPRREQLAIYWNYSCRGHIGWLHVSAFLFGFFIRPFYSGYLPGTTVLIILSIYMGPVARQVDYHLAIPSILCCAYITTIIVIFISSIRWPTKGHSSTEIFQYYQQVLSFFFLLSLCL